MHRERRFWKGLCRRGWLPSDAPSECMAGQVSCSSLWAPRGLESPSRLNSTPRCGLGSLGRFFQRQGMKWVGWTFCHVLWTSRRWVSGEREAQAKGLVGRAWPLQPSTRVPLLPGLVSFRQHSFSGDSHPSREPGSARLSPAPTAGPGSTTSVQHPLPLATSPAGPPIWGTDFISLLKCSQPEAQRPLNSDGSEQMPPRCPLPSEPPNLARRVPLPAAMVTVENPNLWRCHYRP